MHISFIGLLVVSRSSFAFSILASCRQSNMLKTKKLPEPSLKFKFLMATALKVRSSVAFAQIIKQYWTGLNYGIELKAGFRQLFGLSIFDCLHEARMEKAKEAPTYYNKPIKEICILAGYRGWKFYYSLPKKIRLYPGSLRRQWIVRVAKSFVSIQIYS